MENKNQNEVYGPATYMTQLADQYGFAQHWASITNPSQPNYIAYIGASTFGVTGDGNHPNLNHPTIVDLIENTGHTWKAFGEDASGTGCGLNPPRGEDHFPFLSYTTITGSPSRCANLLPGSGNEVINAFNAGTNFIWLTPNDCNNMHSCSVATGDNYIHGWVPQLLTAMNGKNALLILTFDEAYTNPPYIYHAFIGPAAKLAYKSTVEYTHYSLAKMIEDVWGGGNLGQNDVSANSPVEFFLPGGPDFGLVANPTSVSFAAGGSATSTISLTASGGFTGTVGLTASSAPAGVATTCVPASISGSQTSTCTFSAANAGSYSVTITGTSGTLVHTAAVSVTVTAAGPVARFTFAPAYPQVNDTVTFDASSSTDSDPTATLQARWDWAGDGTWDTPYSSVLTAQHAFAAAGTSLVKVQIQDNHALTDTASHAVVVSPLGGGGAGAPPGYGLIDPSKLQPHGPIAILANTDFTAANGVRSGTGTATDPFVISDWFIDGNLYTTTQVMVWIESTNLYVVVENNRITNLAGTNQWEAFQVGHWPAILATQHVTFRHNSVENAQHAYGFGIREGSTDIHIEANYVGLDSTYEWLYGIEADRNVHDVTVFGNYVNAYTSGTFHTTGIQLGDVHVDDARRTTGVTAIHNTVVNATGTGIAAESAVGTILAWNLVYDNYPSTKVIGTDYPRGLQTDWYANGSVVLANVIHTVHWGIVVGADGGIFALNSLTDVDYGIYVLDAGAWTGVSTSGETIFATSYAGVANTAIRLPANFQGTVIDVGPGIRTSDLTALKLATLTAATRIALAWTGRALNVSATVGGTILYDIGDAIDSQTLQASWSGSIANLRPTAFSASNVAFQLTSSADVVFDGTGFTPRTMYNLTRTNSGGTSRVGSAQSTPAGGLTVTIPAAPTSTYTLSPGSVGDTVAPVSTASLSGTAGAGQWYSSPVTVTLSATDDLSGVLAIHFQLDGGVWQTYSGAVVVQGEGAHTVGYYATDNSGNNEAIRTASANIDTVAPSSAVQVQGTRAPDGSYIGSANITLAATDASSGVQTVQYRLDGGAWHSYSGVVLLSGNGQHAIDYAATDVAGNVEATKSSVVRISASVGSPPVTTMNVIGTLGANGWYVSDITITLQASSPSGAALTTAYSVDAGGWTTYTQSFVVSEGRHTLAYQSLDAAGYVETVHSSEIDVDLTNPILGVPSPSGRVTTSDVTVSWSGSDGASGIARYEVSIDGGAFESVGLSTSVTRSMASGSHRVDVRAFDNAGHQSTTGTTFTVESTGNSIPGALQSMPLFLPLIALVLLMASFVLIFRHRRGNRIQPRYRKVSEYEEEEEEEDENWDL